jgi:hypothetical protein
VNTLEFRFAVRPDLLIVMSWRDGPEDASPRTLAAHHVRNHNSLVIAQAERQWFHHPDLRPAHSSGSWQALSYELHPGYSSSAAYCSQRWAKVKELVHTPIQTGTRIERIAIMSWRDHAA